MRGPALAQHTEKRFNDYLDQVGGVLRDKRQRASFAIYATGLLSDGERKSMEPLAARACGDPDLVSAMHNRLMHFTTTRAWTDMPVRRIAAHYAVEEMQRQEPITTWVIDDTGFLKQGKHSPGVQRQYTGSAGKTANCQIGVSLVVANSHAEVPVDFRLYIPRSWADDRPRCKSAHIPDDVGYSPNWRLALDMIESALDAKIPSGIVLADSAYGHVSEFREGLDALGLKYAISVKKNTIVRRVSPGGTLGKPISVKQLGRQLKSRFKKTIWREASKVSLHSNFVRVRVVVGSGDDDRASQWLLIEWPHGEDDPSDYVLSTLPMTISLTELVTTAKNRWRVERSYEDLKGQLGLDHYEGRSFVGWHHHVTVALVCYAFLVAEKARIFFPAAARSCPHSSLAYAA
jgi:SRSO17 transposase